MIKKILASLILIMLFGDISLFPQENIQGNINIKTKSQIINQVPFVSLLTVKYDKGAVSIDFEPLKDPSYSYKIYRSTTAILKEFDLSTSNLIKVIKGNDLPFKDIPNAEGNYYYAVIVTRNGQDYKKLIPFQNTLVYSVDFSPYPKPIKITKIDKQKGNRVAIYINPVNKSWKYILYVSNKQIKNLKGLKPLQIIIGPKNHFDITLEKGINYFFAVTVKNRLGVENNSLIPNQNSTVKPFKLEEEEKKTVSLKKPVEKAPKIEASQPKPVKKPTPNFKAKSKIIHKQKPNTESAISITISKYFIKGKYKRSIQELNWILKAYPTTGRQKSKIYFYLGQSYFYIKNYKKALKYFILCKDFPYYKREADTWIDRVLLKIK